MNYPVAKLSELIDPPALGPEAEGHVTFDRLRGEWIVTLGEFMQRAEDEIEGGAEELSEEELAKLPEWQKLEREEARAILEDKDGRFVDAPDRFEFNEYRLMENFIGTVEDEKLADRLWQAIQGKGAFGRFKRVAVDMDMLQKWYDYLKSSKKDFFIEWARENGIEVKDDMVAQPA
jgi:hypothetical protein